MAKTRDFMSGLINCIGASLSLIGLVILIIFASINGDAFDIVSFTLFGTGLLLTYLFSTLYHWLNIGEKKLNVFKKLSNIAKFVLIVAGFTTICLGPLRGPWGWSIFGVVLTLNIIGIVFSSIWVKLPLGVSIPLYIVMGLVSLITFIPLIFVYKNANILYSLWWIIISCLFYFMSFLVYKFKWQPNKFTHISFYDFFYILLILGCVFQFWFVLNYITIF